LEEPASFVLRRKIKEIKRERERIELKYRKLQGETTSHRLEKPALNGRMPNERVK
jgi:hypothetical protein